MPTCENILAGKTGKVVTCSKSTTVSDACKNMVENKVGAVLVVDEEDCLLGIFTERDLLNKVMATDKNPKSTLLEEVMTTRLAVGHREMTLMEAGELLSQNRIRHLPIIENCKLVGVVSSGDVLAWKLKESETQVRHLENYFFSG